MVKSLKPLVILLQEMMMEGAKAIEVIEPGMKDWSFSHINFDGHLGGLLTSWSPDLSKIKIKSYETLLKIVLEDRGPGETFSLYNVYGPYHNKRKFWEFFFSSGLLEPQNMILGGDMNLSLSEREVWGSSMRMYSLSNFFLALFKSKGLLYVHPLKVETT